MKRFRISLIQLLIFTGFLLNIERVDIGTDQNIINLETFMYIIAGIAISSTILLPNKWKLSTRTIATFWVIVYLIIKIGRSPEHPFLGGVHTYLTIVEISLLILAVILTRRVLEDMQSIENIIANITLADLSSRVKNLDQAMPDINKEIIRSRRYQRPLSILAIQISAETMQTNAEHLSQDIINTMLSRYAMSSLIRAIDKEIRRPDLILKHSEDNQIILMLPETDEQGTKVVIDNMKTIAHNIVGESVSLGAATFPQDALTFEELIKHAATHTHSAKNSPHLSNEMPFQIQQQDIRKQVFEEQVKEG